MLDLILSAPIFGSSRYGQPAILSVVSRQTNQFCIRCSCRFWFRDKGVFKNRNIRNKNEGCVCYIATSLRQDAHASSVLQHAIIDNTFSFPDKFLGGKVSTACYRRSTSSGNGYLDLFSMFLNTFSFRQQHRQSRRNGIFSSNTQLAYFFFFTTIQIM